ncbi:hypothetical protein Cgig2_011626 [Carnegiea gigantea]|uniref:Centromere protein S n=1 Tax=Carnegiea gigantea TaxID=171969 RepID=A0A9Q1GQ58_9CARY|nr:hypothetical protein Cgig2_011626 [Carnegiea gigantea]
MESERAASDTEMDEREVQEDDEETQLLRDRFRLSAISIVEAEAKKSEVQVAEPIVACISDLAFNYADLKFVRVLGFIEEHLARDLELFAHHAGRKLVNTEDVILAAHRNDKLAVSLRAFCNDLKAKEPQSERKRKKASRREDKATTSAIQIDDL